MSRVVKYKNIDIFILIIRFQLKRIELQTFNKAEADKIQIKKSSCPKRETRGVMRQFSFLATTRHSHKQRRSVDLQSSSALQLRSAH